MILSVPGRHVLHSGGEQTAVPVILCLRILCPFIPVVAVDDSNCDAVDRVVLVCFVILGSFAGILYDRTKLLLITPTTSALLIILIMIN